MLIAFTTSKMACVLVAITGDQVGNLDQLLAILFSKSLDHDFCMHLEFENCHYVSGAILQRSFRTVKLWWHVVAGWGFAA